MPDTHSSISPPSIASEEPSAPNFFDKFFITVTAFGFGLGTAIALLPNIIPLAIIPAIFYGTGIGALVYRFMGGLKGDDSLSTKTIKISGSLASLLGSIVIINLLLDAQLKTYLGENTVELMTVENQSLVVKNKQFKVGKLTPEALHRTSYYNIEDSSLIEGLKQLQLKNDSHPVLKAIINQCRGRRTGFCAPSTKEFPITVSISEAVSKGKASACATTSDDFWEEVSSVTIYKSPTMTSSLRLNDLNGNCIDEANNRQLIISEEDATRLDIKAGEQVKGRRRFQ